MRWEMCRQASLDTDDSTRVYVCMNECASQKAYAPTYTYINTYITYRKRKINAHHIPFCHENESEKLGWKETNINRITTEFNENLSLSNFLLFPRHISLYLYLSLVKCIVYYNEFTNNPFLLIGMKNTYFYFTLVKFICLLIVVYI